ncbi:uncharacterized protein LOC108087014 [Drosophila ficusphila]|uniref:uncharacterized protein LOC108087014 n=1 Tax=Drosophila ficusphila TaxID=30025 RepID=UPI0007E7F942|nr:uncharacterized protein LOC108087014 [Drosophila ficusphila]
MGDGIHQEKEEEEQGKRDCGHGSGPTGNRTSTRTDHNWLCPEEGSFNNKSHDRHGNTEMLFSGTAAAFTRNGMVHVRPASGSWSCQMGADGAARKLPAAAHFNLII